MAWRGGRREATVRAQGRQQRCACPYKDDGTDRYAGPELPSGSEMGREERERRERERGLRPFKVFFLFFSVFLFPKVFQKRGG